MFIVGEKVEDCADFCCYNLTDTVTPIRVEVFGELVQ